MAAQQPTLGETFEEGSARTPTLLRCVIHQMFTPLWKTNTACAHDLIAERKRQHPHHACHDDKLCNNMDVDNNRCDDVF